VVLVINQRVWRKAPQQSVHLTLGILRRPKPFSPLWSFSYTQADSANAPAQVTQAVGQAKNYLR